MVMLYKVGLSGVHSFGESTLKIYGAPLWPVAVALAASELSSCTVISKDVLELVLLCTVTLTETDQICKYAVLDWTYPFHPWPRACQAWQCARQVLTPTRPSAKFHCMACTRSYHRGSMFACRWGFVLAPYLSDRTHVRNCFANSVVRPRQARKRYHLQLIRSIRG